MLAASSSVLDELGFSKETIRQTQVCTKLTEVTAIGGSYGATSKTLTVDHYQKLIDRGWRRYVGS